MRMHKCNLINAPGSQLEAIYGNVTNLIDLDEDTALVAIPEG